MHREMIFGMDNALLTVLRMHNPWLDQPAEQTRLLQERLPSPFLPRRARLELKPGRAEVVVGPRQAGKSTWISHNLAGLQDPVLILHAEEHRIREIAASPAVALNVLAEVMHEATILFLEEVQHLSEASLFIKSLIDLDRKRRIVATGSASFALQSRTRESLAGRGRRTLLLPFSLREVEGTLPAGLSVAIRNRRLEELWERILITGGYPEVWFESNQSEILRYLVEAFVLKDVTDLHTVEQPAAFRKLLELAAADIGNLVNLSEWASMAQVSRTTAGRYLEIAEQAHILRLIPPFVGGRRAEVTGRPKVFFVDNGLRNAVFGGFETSSRRADRGQVWENAVFGELLKEKQLLDQVFFWRSKNGAEVDFVVRRQDRLLALEVKAGALRRPKLSRSARSFISAYRPDGFCVVNSALSCEDSVDGVPVRYCRPWELTSFLDESD